MFHSEEAEFPYTDLLFRAASRYSDSLRAGRSGDRIPMGTKFSAPVQTVPGAYPASCTIGTRSFLGVKWPWRGLDHPLLSSSEVKERVQVYFYSPSGPSWPVLGWTLPFYLTNLTIWFLWWRICMFIQRWDWIIVYYVYPYREGFYPSNSVFPCHFSSAPYSSY